MSEIYNFRSQDQRFDEASLWIAKLEKGLSEEDETALRQWMAADPKNQQIFLKMAEMWDRMDTLSRLSDLCPRQAIKKTKSPQFLLAMAASVMVAVLVGVWGMSSTTLSDLLGGEKAAVSAGVVYGTSIGEQSVVNLPDGTVLALNTDSLVRVIYTDQRRLLELERGEINVQVAHDKSRPLSVIAGDKVIQAVGTVFNIEIHKDQLIELLVTEGKVLVGVHQRQTSVEDLSGDSTQPVVAVSGGEGLMLGSSEEEIKRIEPEEIEVKLSWKQGNLIFRGESLDDAVAEIGRYTSVEFVILDEDLKKLRISGLFRAGDVDGLLNTLKENFNIYHTRVGEEKVLLKGRLVR